MKEIIIALLFICGYHISWSQSSIWVNKKGNTIETRIYYPKGFERKQYPENSFAHYLQTFLLKPDGSKVYLYSGEEKYNQNIHVAVLDISVGKKDLQQCADAVMRLRAEYLFEQKRYNDIHFNFTNGFNAEYSKWIQGYRIKVSGNKVSWYKAGNASNTRADFDKYLDLVFSYAGTLSLNRELKNKLMKDIEPGDVFIQGGSPGHAVIVVDVAENKSTGEKIFCIAQSYMPAQDIHILKNPNSESGSPWYKVDEYSPLDTPEWDFSENSLMKFE